MSRSDYKTLDLEPEANREQIDEAYYKKIKNCNKKIKYWKREKKEIEIAYNSLTNKITISRIIAILSGIIGLILSPAKIVLSFSFKNIKNAIWHIKNPIWYIINAIWSYIPKVIDEKFRQYPEIVTLILSIIGIFVLAYSASNEWGEFAPQEIKLSELEEYEGMTVRVEAEVTDAYHLSSGPWIIDIEDGSTNETMILFANSLNFIPKTGDVLEITGESARYKGQWEIIAQANQVEIISKWNEDKIAVSDIANDPAYYDGKVVTIRTYVKSSPTTSYNTTSFNVGDTYENLRIETEETTELPVMITGDYVEITGTLRFDTYWFSYQIVLEEETHKVEIIS